MCIGAKIALSTDAIVKVVRLVFKLKFMTSFVMVLTILL